MYAETCNMAEGLKDDKEEIFERHNPDLVPLLLVNLDELLLKKQGQLKPGSSKGKVLWEETIEGQSQRCGEK